MFCLLLQVSLNSLNLPAKSHEEGGGGGRRGGRGGGWTDRVKLSNFFALYILQLQFNFELKFTFICKEIVFHVSQVDDPKFNPDKFT